MYLRISPLFCLFRHPHPAIASAASPLPLRFPHFPDFSSVFPVFSPFSLFFSENYPDFSGFSFRRSPRFFPHFPVSCEFFTKVFLQITAKIELLDRNCSKAPCRPPPSAPGLSKSPRPWPSLAPALRPILSAPFPAPRSLFSLQPPGRFRPLSPPVP